MKKNIPACNLWTLLWPYWLFKITSLFLPKRKKEGSCCNMLLTGLSHRSYLFVVLTVTLCYLPLNFPLYMLYQQEKKLTNSGPNFCAERSLKVGRNRGSFSEDHRNIRSDTLKKLKNRWKTKTARKGEDWTHTCETCDKGNLSWMLELPVTSDIGGVFAD